MPPAVKADFARWLIRQVHGARLVASQGALSTAAPLRIARVVVPVCADCNAGWMSGLEVSFRRMLFARPRTGPLQAPDRFTLSRWFTKTAVLLAHAYGGALVGAEHRAQLVSGIRRPFALGAARPRNSRIDRGYARLSARRATNPTQAVLMGFLNATSVPFPPLRT